MKACMGGWCRIRENCGHYDAADKRHPGERLCLPGKDGQRAPKYIPVRIVLVKTEAEPA